MKSAIKYQLWERKRPLIFYYTIVYAVYIFVSMLLVSGIFNIAEMSVLISMWIASAILIFVVGLNSFKEPFGMLMQNHITRKNFFITIILSMILCATFMSLIDTTNVWIMRFMFGKFPIFLEIYQIHDVSNTGIWIDSFFLYFSIFIMTGTVGLLIAATYYRMNKHIRILVSVGVPVVLCMVLPIIDSLFLRGLLGNAVYQFLIFLLADPYYLVFACLSAAAVAALFCWLMIKKAVVKD